MRNKKATTITMHGMENEVGVESWCVSDISFCCADFSESFFSRVFMLHGQPNYNNNAIILKTVDVYRTIRYCPFCGGEVKFKEVKA